VRVVGSKKEMAMTVAAEQVAAVTVAANLEMATLKAVEMEERMVMVSSALMVTAVVTWVWNKEVRCIKIGPQQVGCYYHLQASRCRHSLRLQIVLKLGMMVIRFAWTQQCTMETTIEKHCSTTQNPQTMRRRT